MNLSKNTKIGTYSSGNKDRDLFSGFSAIPNEYVSHKKSTLKASDGIEFGNYNFYVSSNTKVFKSDTPIYDGDKLILGTGGDFASVNYSINPFSSSGDTLVMSYEGLNNKYMYFYWKQYLNQITNCFQGTKLKHLKRSFFNNIILNVPSIEIQNKIEKILSKQQDYIDSIKTLLSNLETRNTYLADKLLSGEIRLRENEDGELETYRNNVSGTFVLNNKERVYYSGFEPKPHSYKIETKSKLPASHGTEEGEYNFFVSSNLKSLKTDTPIYENESLIFGTGGDFASINYSEKPFSSSNSTMVIRYETENTKYMYYYWKNKIDDITRCFLGTKLKSLKTELFNKMHISVPIRAEQDIIALFLSNNENTVNRYKELLKLEEQRFEWLSESLLSGEYQLVD